MLDLADTVQGEVAVALELATSSLKNANRRERYEPRRGSAVWKRPSMPVMKEVRIGAPDGHVSIVVGHE
jgi:hypothetical protein